MDYSEEEEDGKVFRNGDTYTFHKKNWIFIKLQMIGIMTPAESSHPGPARDMLAPHTS